MKKFLFAGFAFFLCIAPLASAFALCACCAEPGHYSISTRKLDRYVSGELKKLKFDAATLYTDAGYPETIKGLAPLGEDYSADASLSGSSWKFTFKDDGARTGALNLAKPFSMIEYMVDQEPTTSGEPPKMVSLYKEWRFKYRVETGNGFFRRGITPKTEYFLVLHGSGNACTSAADFKYWRLEVSGVRAKYAFFGKLSGG